VTYRYDAYENGVWVGNTSCTTGVDCTMITPEPATVALFGSGLLGILAFRVRGRRKRLSAMEDV
jgi:hypothetical protein